MSDMDKRHRGKKNNWTRTIYVPVLRMAGNYTTYRFIFVYNIQVQYNNQRQSRIANKKINTHWPLKKTHETVISLLAFRVIYFCGLSIL